MHEDRFPRQPLYVTPGDYSPEAMELRKEKNRRAKERREHYKAHHKAECERLNKLHGWDLK
jgi:hypothetical protein